MTTKINDPSDETSAKEAAEQPTARGPGRPSKLTPELEAAIFECLQLGLTIGETCDVCGVSETQFRSWRQHYPDFAAMVRRGQSEAVKTHLAIIREAAGKRWQASAWWLERRCPQRWGRTERQTLEDRREAETEAEESEVMMLEKLLMEYRNIVNRMLREREGIATTGPAGAEAASVDVPEAGAEFEDKCEDPEFGKGDEPGSDTRRPASVPHMEDREIAFQALPSSPPPCEEEALQSAPCAVKTPTVFIGGARNGEAAEYDEADELTHEQDGYRLMEVVFEHKGRDRCLKVLGDPVMRIAHVGSEAGRLFLAGNRAVAEALAAQERAFRTNGWRS